MGVNRNVPMMDARKVAEIGYRGMMRGQRVVIPGVLNKVMSAGNG
jgi:short-subunit dehydrogenase